MTETASAFVISITPFTADGGFDEAGLRRHLRRMAAAGIGIYLGGGGSGEGYVLSASERRRLLEIGVEEVQGLVPVRAMGTEPRSAEEMAAFVAGAADAGVDAVQIYPLDQGHGHRPTPAEIEAYFEEVLAATALPAVLSTHPSVGYRVPVDVLARLAARHPQVIGVNCSHPDLHYLSGIIDAVGDRLDVHVGGPQLALTAWSLGATGFLSSEANLVPELCAAVVDAYRACDARPLFTAFGALLRLSTALYRAGGIRATKGVLDQLGLPAGPPRRPQLPADPAAVEEILALARHLDVLPGEC